ncbi:hypothetical protein SELMODRAFT_407937 [Selaginella moellendorffii]|uniref:Pentacotripeptide-repeat region of PRORP domain-containing protein n=1 Tax=Selaginella moellendorffii TaxID=88036 RepID=D8R593_SELML|nr:hypothetical protein SELMODRAFT_407937 [Selaginella moellendorffii]
MAQARVAKRALGFSRIAAQTRSFVKSRHAVSSELLSAREIDWRPEGKRMFPSKEALALVTEIKRAARGKKDVERLLKDRSARMMRYDYLIVLLTLKDQDQVDRVLEIFDVIREEMWYKPSAQLFQSIMEFVIKHDRIEDWKRLLKNLHDEKLEPSEEMLVFPVRKFASLANFAKCMEIYEAIKAIGCKVCPNFYAFLIAKLTSAGELERAEILLKDLEARHKLQKIRLFHRAAPLLGSREKNVGFFWADTPDPRPSKSKVFRPEKIPKEFLRLREFTQEAMQTVTALRHRKNDPDKVDSYLETNAPRMLKKDMLCVLTILRKHREEEIALKVFRIIEKESWYEPNSYLYRELILILTNLRRFDELWTTMDEMDANEMHPNRHMFVPVMSACFDLFDFQNLERFYNRMLKTPGLHLHHLVYRGLIKKLQAAEQEEFAQRVTNDLADYIKLQKKRGVPLIEHYDDFWRDN